MLALLATGGVPLKLLFQPIDYRLLLFEHALFSPEHALDVCDEVKLAAQVILGLRQQSFRVGHVASEKGDGLPPRLRLFFERIKLGAKIKQLLPGGLWVIVTIADILKRRVIGANEIPRPDPRPQSAFGGERVELLRRHIPPPTGPGSLGLDDHESKLNFHYAPVSAVAYMAWLFYVELSPDCLVG